MARNAPNFEQRLAEVVKERQRLENDLAKKQEKLRGINRQANPVAYAEALAPVQEAKQRIGDISQEHAELARMVSAMKGGQNFSPPPAT